MTTLMENRLKEAIENKKNDIHSFLWKGVKTLDSNGNYVQTSQKLIDMNEYDLNVCYDHCKKMLFNTNQRSPGRWIVMDLISEQKEKCNAELMLRFVEQEHSISRFNLVGSINTFKKANVEALRGRTPLLEDMFSGLLPQFSKLSLDLIVSACLDQLGVFNKKHITRTFILKQGIWLTAEESKELLSEAYTNRLDVIRENLNLKEIEKIYINSKGLNYTQMRAMLNLKPNKKYIDLTTNQLETLRNRILLSLESVVQSHITSWENRMKEIEMVAKHNNLKL